MTETTQASERPGLAVSRYENFALHNLLRRPARETTGEAEASPEVAIYLDHSSDPYTASHWNGLVVTRQGDRRHVVHVWSVLSSAAHQWGRYGDGGEVGSAEYTVYDDEDARVVTVPQEEADYGPTPDDIRGAYDMLTHYVRVSPGPSAVEETADVRHALEALPYDRLRALGQQMLAGTLTPPAAQGV